MINQTNKQAAQDAVQAILKAGYRAFLAESGTYGFFTDAEGTRVVSFQCNRLRDSVSGNYKTDNPRMTGTGWQIEEGFDPNRIDIYFNAQPPSWATQGAKWQLTTLQQHLDTYQRSSRYEEVLA